MSYYGQLQRIWHEYEKEHGFQPATARAAVEWGVERGMMVLKPTDPYDAAAEAMARALREEVGVDAVGRRYRKNHAVTVTKNGVQITIWNHIDSAPREFMERAFQQRRRGIAGDCMSLDNDMRAYNARLRNTHQKPIQISFDFTAEVDEHGRMIEQASLFGNAA